MKILFYNGKVLTQDEKNPLADAVYIQGNKIKFVGKIAEIKEKIPSSVVEINLNGKILLPGFIDTHTHFTHYAFSKVKIDLSNCYSMMAVKQKVIEFKKNLKKEMSWISGFGWDKNLWDTDNGFDKYFLDKIFPEIPVSLSNKDRHSFLCNSKALARMGITAQTKLPQGSSLGFFPDGSLNGFLYERAWLLIDEAKPSLSRELQERLLKQTIKGAHKLGLTGIHSMEEENAYKLFKSLNQKNQLKLRICWHFPLEMLDEMINKGVKSYTGDDWLTIGGLKLFMDGALGSQTAYMYHAYKNDPENYGYLVYEEEEFYELLVKAGKHEISTLTHSIGDRSNSIVIDAILRARKSPELQKKNLFHRIEHLQCILPEDQKRIARENIYTALQPIHLSLDIKSIGKYLGEFGMNSYPFRSLFDYGATFGFGSDVPVESNNPFLGIYSAIERKYRNNPKNPSWRPDQKITPGQAIRAYTIQAAKGSLQENKFGSITPGKLADMIVIDDYTKYDSSFWLSAKPFLTIVNGEIVYNRI